MNANSYVDSLSSSEHAALSVEPLPVLSDAEYADHRATVVELVADALADAGLVVTPSTEKVGPLGGLSRGVYAFVPTGDDGTLGVAVAVNVYSDEAVESNALKAVRRLADEAAAADRRAVAFEAAAESLAEISDDA